METTKEAPEVPSSRKRKARQRNRRNHQQDSDPADKQAEAGGLPVSYNLNNFSTICLSDETNRKAGFLSDHGRTEIVNEGMETTKEAPEVPSLQKRKARKRSKRRNNQQDSDPAHKQAEEGGLPSTYNLNNVSTVCFADETNREVVLLSDSGETKFVNKGMETTKEAPEVPSLQKRKARKRSKRGNDQQDSDPARQRAEEGGLPSTYNLNNVSTVCISDETNREVVLLSDSDETKLVNKGMETTKEVPEVLRKRKARKRSKKKNNQQDSDPARAEEGGLPSTYNLNNVSTVCLSDETNREVVLLSDSGETKLVNMGMETNKEVPEVPSLRKRKARKRSKRGNNQQGQQAEEGGLPSTYNLNNLSTSDETNREVVLFSDSGETKLVNKGMETTKEVPEILQKRKAIKRRKKRNNQQDSDPAHAEEGGLPSTYNLNNVSTVCLSGERNEVVFLSDNGKTKLVNKGMRTTKEALEVPSSQKRKARRRNRRNNVEDGNPAHMQAEEVSMPSTCNLNNVSTVCLSGERNEVVFLSDNGKTKLVNKGMGTTKEVPEELSLQKRKPRRRNRRRNNQQDSDPAHKQAEEGGSPSTYILNNVSTVCLSDETNKQVVFLSDKGEIKLANKGTETTKEASEVPSLQKTKARRRNRRRYNRQDSETELFSLAICGKENVPPESLSCFRELTPICLLRKKLLILDINGVLVDIVSPPPKGHKADIKIAKKAIFGRPFCFDFLKFCFERFEVGVWSSRTRKNIDRVVEFAMGDLRKKLLFCWDLSKCTATQLRTLENKHKPLVFKELRRIWEKDGAELPWEKGDYSESNTLLLDDSPYKALLNPLHTAIFPYPYQFQNSNDNSLGAGGDLRVYLQELAAADNVQEFVEHHPFGQPAISQRSPNWNFFLKAIRSVCPAQVTR